MTSLLNGFSGRIGEPEGAFRLLDQSSRAELENFVRQLIDQSTATGTGTSGALPPSGIIDDDGTILYDEQIASASKVDTGIYHVTSDVTFDTVGGEYQCAVQVTPRGLLTAPNVITTTDYLGLTTSNPALDGSAVAFDSAKGRLWATDQDHDTNFTSAASDRVGIYRLDTDSWDYIYTPADWSILFLQVGPVLKLDVTNRRAYLQVAGSSDGAYNGARSTLIYDLDSYDLLHNTFVDIAGHGQAQHFMIAIDPSNDRIFLRGDSYIRAYTTDGAGIPDSFIDDETTQTYSGNSHPIVDASGQLWVPTTVHPEDWRKFYLSGGSLLTATADGGPDGIIDGLKCYDATNDLIYYVTGDTASVDDAKELYKFDCGTETYTKITASTLGAIATEGDADASYRNPTSISMSFDDSKLLVVRGGSGGYHDFYIVDPSDGTIDFHQDLGDLYSYNYYTNNPAVDAGVLWSLGTKRIMEIRFQGDNAGSIGTVYKPVIAAARMIAANKAQVELFDANNVFVRRNNAFHITFNGTQ